METSNRMKVVSRAVILEKSNVITVRLLMVTVLLGLAPSLFAAPTSQPAAAYPDISGSWQEAPGVVLQISQTNGDWQAKCSYIRPGFGEVRWEMTGTVTPEGIIKGTLHHTLAPKDFALVQTREARLSDDGNTISGTAKWDGGGNEFTWIRDPHAALAAATAALKQAQLDVEDRLLKLPEYQSLLAVVDAAVAKRDAIKASATATPQDKVDAASAVGTAQKAVDDFKGKFLAADPSVIRATNAVLVVTTEIKADEAVAAAAAQPKPDAAQVAELQAIKTAIAQHTLAIGMTLEQCNAVVGGAGRVAGADTSGSSYVWDQELPGRDKLGNPTAFMHYTGRIVDGKLASFDKAVQPFNAGTAATGDFSQIRR
jgi:hypothetical protein